MYINYQAKQALDVLVKEREELVVVEEEVEVYQHLLYLLNREHPLLLDVILSERLVKVIIVVANLVPGNEKIKIRINLLKHVKSALID